MYINYFMAVIARMTYIYRHIYRGVLIECSLFGNVFFWFLNKLMGYFKQRVKRNNMALSTR